MHSDVCCLGQNESESICRTDTGSLKNLGIKAIPVRSDLLEWVAEIKGLEDTLWEGGVLSLSIYYHERSSKFPPEVVFNTVPFHPNVDKDTGEVCISFPHTGRKWDSSSTFNILRFIQHTLSHPVLEDSVNVEAAEMFLNRPLVYRELVEQCVKASQVLDMEDTAATKVTLNQPLQSGRFVWMISFEEYLQTWIKTATSKGGPHGEPLDTLVSFTQVFSHHPRSSKPKQISYTEACFERIKALMYGPPQKHQRKARQKEDKLQQIQQMRKLYQPNSTAEPSLARPASTPGTAPCPGGTECWETEVDRLVAWTHTLSLEELEDDHSSRVMVTVTPPRA